MKKTYFEPKLDIHLIADVIITSSKICDGIPGNPGEDVLTEGDD